MKAARRKIEVDFAEFGTWAGVWAASHSCVGASRRVVAMARACRDCGFSFRRGADPSISYALCSEEQSAIGRARDPRNLCSCNSDAALASSSFRAGTASSRSVGRRE